MWRPRYASNNAGKRLIGRADLGHQPGMAGRRRGQEVARPRLDGRAKGIGRPEGADRAVIRHHDDDRCGTGRRSDGVHGADRPGRDVRRLGESSLELLRPSIVPVRRRRIRSPGRAANRPRSNTHGGCGAGTWTKTNRGRSPMRRRELLGRRERPLHAARAWSARKSGATVPRMRAEPSVVEHRDVELVEHRRLDETVDPGQVGVDEPTVDDDRLVSGLRGSDRRPRPRRSPSRSRRQSRRHRPERWIERRDVDEVSHREHRGQRERRQQVVRVRVAHDVEAAASGAAGKASGSNVDDRAAARSPG